MGIAAPSHACRGSRRRSRRTVLGGRATGFRTLLIEDGFCRGQNTLALAAESAIWPDLVASRL
jgi:hypothetical protein